MLGTPINQLVFHEMGWGYFDLTLELDLGKKIVLVHFKIGCAEFHGLTG